MEARDGALVAANEDDRRPYRVNQHQDDRDQAADPVNVEGHAAREVEHHSRADGVADKPRPEEAEMPCLQSAGDAFAPNADRIEDERERDDDGCGGGHLSDSQKAMQVPVAA